MLIEDSSAFCCSFRGVKGAGAAERGTGNDSDGDGGASAKDVPMLSVKGEVSAFEEDQQMEEETKVQIESIDKNREKVLAVRKELEEMYEPLAIDMAAVKLYFKKLRDVKADEFKYWEAVEDIADVIAHEYEKNGGDPHFQLMCIRGLLMMLINEKFADYMGQGVSEKILTLIIEILGEDIDDE